MNINDKTFPDYWEKYLNQTLSKKEIEMVTDFLNSNPEWKSLVEDKEQDLILVPDKTIRYLHKDTLLRKIIGGGFVYRVTSIAAAFLVLFMVGVALWKSTMNKEPSIYQAENSMQQKDVSGITTVAMHQESRPIVSEKDFSKPTTTVDTETLEVKVVDTDSLSVTKGNGIIETNSLVAVMPLEKSTGEKVVFTEQLVSVIPSIALEKSRNSYDSPQIVYTQTLVEIEKSEKKPMFFSPSCSFGAVLRGSLQFGDFASCVQDEVFQQVSVLGATAVKKAKDWKDNLFARNSRK